MFHCSELLMVQVQVQVIMGTKIYKALTLLSFKGARKLNEGLNKIKEEAGQGQN